MCLGGDSSKSKTTQEASIAPELRPLFSQTAEQITDLQKFSPWQYSQAGGLWPGFFGSAYGSQQYAPPPGAMAPGTPFLQGGGAVTGNWTGAVPPQGGVAPVPAPTMAAPTAAPQTGIPGQDLGYWQDQYNKLQTELDALQNGPENPSATPQESQAAIIALKDQIWNAANQINQLGGGNIDPSQFPGPIPVSGTGGDGTAPGGGGGIAGNYSGLPGTPLDEFLFPHYQQIPGFTPGQQALSQTQLNRAFSNPLTYQELAAQNLSSTFGNLRYPEASALGLSSNFGNLRYPEASALQLSGGFGNLRFPEAAALGQINYVSGGPLGQAPATLAAMDAVRNPVLNDLALAGLGNSDAIASNLAGAFSPILAQEMATRAAVIPQLTGLGQQLRGGDISAAQLQQQIGGALRAGDISAADLQSQIGAALRAGDIQTANTLMQLGGTAATRESQLINEAFQTQELQRAIEEGRGQAELADFLRRQQLAQSLTTGILGGFPAVTGGTSTTKQSGGGGMLGTVICTELHHQGFMDDKTFAADQKFGNSLPLEVLSGYHFWGIPVVKAMRRSRVVTLLVAPFGLAAAREMRKRVEGGKGSILGRVILDLGIPVCRFIGGIIAATRTVQAG